MSGRIKKLVLMMLAVVCGGSPALAKGKKAPKSELKSFSYYMGGGMLIEQQDMVELELENNGKRTLTLRGSCYYERISFEVGEEVFQKVDSIIHATKLYESKGDYKYDVMILDAPSSSFGVTYTNYKENFSGSGDMPGEIWKGMGEVISYLKSLRGGREARGHMRTIRRLDSNSPIKGTEWVDGNLSYLPEDDPDELFVFLSAKYGFDFVGEEWQLSYAEGSGQRCIIAINQRHSIYDVLVDKTTLGTTIPETDNEPLTSQRVLTKSDLADKTEDELRQMAKDLYDRQKRREATDVEQQNHELIQRAIKR